MKKREKVEMDLENVKLHKFGLIELTIVSEALTADGKKVKKHSDGSKLWVVKYVIRRQWGGHVMQPLTKTTLESPWQSDIPWRPKLVERDDPRARTQLAPGTKFEWPRPLVRNLKGTPAQIVGKTRDEKTKQLWYDVAVPLLQEFSEKQLQLHGLRHPGPGEDTDKKKKLTIDEKQHLEQAPMPGQLPAEGADGFKPGSGEAQLRRQLESAKRELAQRRDELQTVETRRLALEDEILKKAAAPAGSAPELSEKKAERAAAAMAKPAQATPPTMAMAKPQEDGLALLRPSSKTETAVLTDDTSASVSVVGDDDSTDRSSATPRDHALLSDISDTPSGEEDEIDAEVDRVLRESARHAKEVSSGEMHSLSTVLGWSEDQAADGRPVRHSEEEAPQEGQGGASAFAEPAAPSSRLAHAPSEEKGAESKLATSGFSFEFLR